MDYETANRPTSVSLGAWERYSLLYIAQFSVNVAINIVHVKLFPKVWRLRHKLTGVELSHVGSVGIC